jgi:hypothetical protein
MEKRMQAMQTDGVKVERVRSRRRCAIFSA